MVATSNRVVAGAAAVLLGLVDGLGALVGQTGASVALTAIIAALTLWTAGYAASLRRAGRGGKGDTFVSWPPEVAIPYHDKVKRRFVRIN